MNSIPQCSVKTKQNLRNLASHVTRTHFDFQVVVHFDFVSLLKVFRFLEFKKKLTSMLFMLLYISVKLTYVIWCVLLYNVYNLYIVHAT